MRFITGLIVLGGIAGLVALLAPIDGGSLLILTLKHGDGAMKLKAIVVAAAFGLAVVLGLQAMAKQRMSRLNSICTLVGFAAAGFCLEIWNFIKILIHGANIQVTGLILTIAVVVGLIGSILAIIKNDVAY
jgi:hypothetical protein